MDLEKFRALARNWEALADADPLFGVLSDPTKQHGRWDTDEFFASGQAHVAKLLRILASLGVSYPRGTCLDFGCGVGRLTIPLAAHFEQTVGVDVARAMVAAATRAVKPADRCRFVVNRDPDLRQFKRQSFDFVHSCLVLQHIPPDVSVNYIREFLRIARPGGLVVFQLPAETRTQEQISAMYALPEDGFRADLALIDAPVRMEAGSEAMIHVRVGNASGLPWPHDIPAGRHICLANHWWHADGRMAVPDDGRARLPRTLEAGDAVAIPLSVHAPPSPGQYHLEVDLVQERVCWFAQHGSQTARMAIDVIPASTIVSADAPAPPPSPRASWFTKIRRRLKGGEPTFEMHVVPRAEIERVVAASGGSVLHAVDDNAAGEGWLSYTYICRR